MSIKDMKITEVPDSSIENMRLKTMQRPDGFIEIIEGVYVISKCLPMQRILVKFKNEDKTHVAFENHHPTEEVRVRSTFMSSLTLGQGSMFKYEKIELGTKRTKGEKVK